MTTNESEWMTVEEAATLLELSSRQVNHLGNQQRIRTRRSGIRVLYHRGDVEQLARERISSTEPKTKLPRVELMPIGEYKNHVQELEGQLVQMARRIGQLEGELLASKNLLEDRQRLQSEVEQLRQAKDQAERERYRLELELEYLRKQIELERQFYKQDPPSD